MLLKDIKGVMWVLKWNVTKHKLKQTYNSLTMGVELTLSTRRKAIVPYANNLDPDETPSNSAFHPDPSFLTLRQHFLPTLSDIAAL